MSEDRTPLAVHLMAKPVGPLCNLDCRYCFYLDKTSLYPGTHRWSMSDEVLERYISQTIAANDVPEVEFAWQGGEPTLLGVGFFRKALELQRRHAQGKRIRNALQTNGTLLDDEWCRFLAGHDFLVGISLDGPRELHDAYRRDKRQRPSFDRVMRGLELLHRHRVAFNTLTVVNRRNAEQPLEVYEFLKKVGSGYLQFIPLVDRAAPARALPVVARGEPAADGSGVAPWSVLPDQYGRFLCEIFDAWVRRDVGRVFVQLFDVALGIWAGEGSSLCLFAPTCGRALAIEHNGDVYACDHFVHPDYLRGNVVQQGLRGIVLSESQRAFGQAKHDDLPKACRQCEVRFACQGECPKNRFGTTADGEPGLNFLCAAYRRFFHHVDRDMRAMAALVAAGRPARDIMRLREAAGEPAGMTLPRSVPTRAGRNDSCPCGSGRKFKRCCAS